MVCNWVRNRLGKISRKKTVISPSEVRKSRSLKSIVCIFLALKSENSLAASTLTEDVSTYMYVVQTEPGCWGSMKVGKVLVGRMDLGRKLYGLPGGPLVEQ